MSEVKTTRKKIFELWELLSKKQDNKDKVYSAKLAYCIFKNKETILDMLTKAQKDLSAPVDAEQEAAFDAERVALCEQYSTKDAEGKPKVENNIYAVEDNQKEALALEVENLKKDKYKELFQKVDAKTIAMNSLLTEEITIDLYQLDINDIVDSFSTDDMEYLSLLIKG